VDPRSIRRFGLGCNIYDIGRGTFVESGNHQLTGSRGMDDGLVNQFGCLRFSGQRNREENVVEAAQKIRLEIKGVSVGSSLVSCSTVFRCSCHWWSSRSGTNDGCPRELRQFESLTIMSMEAYSSNIFGFGFQMI